MITLSLLLAIVIVVVYSPVGDAIAEWIKKQS